MVYWNHKKVKPQKGRNAMALLQVTFVSNTLKRAVPLTVILPVDKIFADPTQDSPAPFKTLYLLHGLLGNCSDWTANTRIQQLAEEKNLAVVMPSGDNSFYIDQPMPNCAYGEFIGKELVEITRKMFPLSHKREDTFIAGLSMGGFGAIRNGLAYGETFSHIAGLSSAVYFFEVPQTGSLMGEDWVFGDLAEAAKTDKNPRVGLANLKQQNIPLPKVYMCCGLQDRLLPANRSLRDHFLAEGVDLTYVESEGNHNWDFWHEYLPKILQWLPLEKSKAGLNSGNVSVK